MVWLELKAAFASRRTYPIKIDPLIAEAAAELAGVVPQVADHALGAHLSSQRLATSGSDWRGRSAMAPDGQAARQTPQPKQRVGSM